MLRESCSVYERYANTPSKVAQKLYFCPQWAGHFVCKPDFYIERKHYQSILLLYSLRGCGKLNYRGEKYTLPAGSIALLNCMDLHTYFPSGTTQWEFRFLHFKGAQSMAFYEHIYSLNGGAVFAKNSRIELYLNDCIKSMREKDTGYEVFLFKRISDILYALIMQVQRKECSKVDFVCDYIDENYMQDLTTDCLAQLAGFSRCHFSTVFKKYAGTTLHDYLLCCRLNAAKALLMEEDFSIGQIAEKTGFNDVATFIRAFKKKEKATPLQYKKRIGHATPKEEIDAS